MTLKYDSTVRENDETKKFTGYVIMNSFKKNYWYILVSVQL